ncbi:MAG: peptidylprolyl isomerase [Streptosporangiales bacterium]|nr:peptidylprolyl isomerase [Streptosporangiales bacterium]
MSGKDRRRRLARQRYERQLRRRVEKRQRARRRNAVLASGVAVVLALGGVSYLGVRFVQQRAAANTVECTYTRESGEQAKYVGRPPAKLDSPSAYRATITTNRGQIVIDLPARGAACTVNSFRFLAGKNFYDDTKCHRLTTEGIYVLQCGDPSGTGQGGPGYSFPDENLTGATYPRGTVAMANSGPNTNGSQFFVVYRKGKLEPKYTPFGTVVKGLDIVEKVAEEGTTDLGAPRNDVIIKDIVVKGRT